MSQLVKNVWCETLTLGPKGAEIILGIDKATGELTIGSPDVAQAVRKIPYRYLSSLTSVGNIGGGADTLMSKVIPYSLIPDIGQMLEFRATFHVANTAGTKTTKAVIDSTEIASIVSPENLVLAQIAEGEILRESATVVHVHVRMFDAGSNGALGTQWAEFHNLVTVVAGASFTLKFTGTAAGAANDDITQDSLTITVLP
jgi:hypothetical protein